ncbi:unnamed protein product [Protopolystoma xenopodis]|uniref:Uncharacterized protein n=1 Tax=Protopolystoma xenopodis TaxID=117903 RepID=A0A3S5CVE0_9PLAT|nr:unnamed protein product [Protopolystoma xenopodis]
MHFYNLFRRKLLLSLSRLTGIYSTTYFGLAIFMCRLLAFVDLGGFVGVLECKEIRDYLLWSQMNTCCPSNVCLDLQPDNLCQPHQVVPTVYFTESPLSLQTLLNRKEESVNRKCCIVCILKTDSVEIDNRFGREE